MWVRGEDPLGGANPLSRSSPFFAALGQNLVGELNMLARDRSRWSQ